MPQLKEVAANFQSNYGVRLGLVVLDTLAATFMLQDENDNSEASKIIRVLSTMSQALDCLVMPVTNEILNLSQWNERLGIKPKKLP